MDRATPENGFVEAVHSAEVIIDGGGVGAGSLTNLFAGGPIKALLGEHLPGGLQKFLPSRWVVPYAGGKF